MDAVLRGQQAGEEGGARRRADRRGGEGVGHAQAAGGKVIQRGRVQFLGAVAAGGPLRVIVAHDDQQVRACHGGLLGRALHCAASYSGTSVAAWYTARAGSKGSRLEREPSPVVNYGIAMGVLTSCRPPSATWKHGPCARCVSCAMPAPPRTRGRACICMHCDINTPLLSYHDHNELQRIEALEKALTQGDVAPWSATARHAGHRRWYTATGGSKGSRLKAGRGSRRELRADR